MEKKASIDSLKFGKQYKIGKKIGAGSFGLLRLGTNTITGESVAVKLEINRTRGMTLPMEYHIYRTLGENEGVPKVYYFGPCGKYNALVMELLGPSVEKLFQNCDKKLSVKSVIQIALQMLRRIEYVHSKGVVYRDIKPENFLFGRPDSKRANTLLIIDFGLAKFYIDRKTKKHIPYKEGKYHTGTARYMSINTHLGKEQSRRDDLEAIGHLLLYLCRGGLPWQNLKVKSKEARYKAILNMKQNTPLEVLCHGCPPEFVTYMKYARNLDFYETPKYDYLRQLFINLFERENYVDDNVYDWSKQKVPEDTVRPVKTESTEKLHQESQEHAHLIEEFKHLQGAAYEDPTKQAQSESSSSKRKQVQQ